MRKLIVIFCVLLIASSSVSAQGSLCQIDLSRVTALLTRAQSLAAQGEPDQALTVMMQADGTLNAVQSRCDLPIVTSEVELEESFTASDNSFTLSFPTGWTVSPAAVPTSISIGTDVDAASVSQTADPTLESGQQGALIVFGTPAMLTANQSVVPNLEGVIRFLQAQLADLYLVRNDLQYFMLDGRPAAQFEFAGEGFDGIMIVVELIENRQYAAVAGAAAKTELEDFRPLITSIAASVTQGG